MITGKPSSSKDRSAWIMTRFDEKAVNFEGLAWREMSSENIKQHLVDALLALSALHKIHIAHKDAFMRNLVRLSGTDGDNSATRYIDIEKDTALERRFQTIVVKEPTLAQAISTSKIGRASCRERV